MSHAYKRGCLARTTDVRQQRADWTSIHTLKAHNVIAEAFLEGQVHAQAVSGVEVYFQRCCLCDAANQLTALHQRGDIQAQAASMRHRSAARTL